MNLVKLSKYFGLYNLYVSMFQCFTETNEWPGISAGFLCNICQNVPCWYLFLHKCEIKKKTVQQGYHPCRKHQHVIGMVLAPVNQFEFMLPASGCLNFLISRNISDILKREKEIYKNDC